MPKFTSDIGATIFYDGLVLAEGERPLTNPPHFSDPNGSRGEWGEEPFVNLLRNPSAEQAGPRIRLFVDNLSTKVLPVKTRLSLILTSFLDWRATGRYYENSARHLFQTFWARFGWGHILLIGEPFSYWMLAGFTLVALFGCIVGVVRRERGIPWDLIVFMGMGSAIAWGATLTRGVTTLALAHQYVPVARHACPLIIPSALFLCLGWMEVFYMVNFFVSRPLSKEDKTDVIPSGDRSNFIHIYQHVIYFSLLVLLDLASLFSIARFFGKF
jgi:hypothetical protein